MELFEELSRLVVDAMLRDPSQPGLMDELTTWRRDWVGFRAKMAIGSCHDFNDIYAFTDAVYPPSCSLDPALHSYQDVVMSRLDGCLYDGRSGFVVPESLGTRMTRSQRVPAVKNFHIQLDKPLEALHRIDKAIVIPRISTVAAQPILYELMAYLWPWLDDFATISSGLPVLIQSDLQESIQTPLFALIRSKNGFPLLQSHLPSRILIHEALVPSPSMSLLVGCTPLHVQACVEYSQVLCTEEVDMVDIKGDCKRIFLVDRTLPSTKSRVYKKLVRFLANNGWTMIDASTTTLVQRLAAYRLAKVIAGLDSRYFLELGFVGNLDKLPFLLLIGDAPSLDLVFLARSMALKGKWLRVFGGAAKSLAGNGSGWLLGGRKIGLILNDLSEKPLLE